MAERDSACLCKPSSGATRRGSASWPTAGSATCLRKKRASSRERLNFLSRHINQPPHRQVRTVQRGHGLPRRDRRHVVGHPGQGPAAVAESRFRTSGGTKRADRPADDYRTLEDPGGPSPSSPSTGDELDLAGFIRGRLDPDASDLYSDTHREVDGLLLAQVLEYTEGNQHRAARLLGISRQTLRLRLGDLGLHVRRRVEDDR